MKTYKTTCEYIDDCTIIVDSEYGTAVVGQQSPYVYVINPRELVGCNVLITYAAHSDYLKLKELVGSMCVERDCESYFSSDPERHLKNGYQFSDSEKEILQGHANRCLNEYVMYMLRTRLNLDIPYNVSLPIEVEVKGFVQWAKAAVCEGWTTEEHVKECIYGSVDE